MSGKMSDNIVASNITMHSSLFCGPLVTFYSILSVFLFLVRDVIYTSRAYSTMSVSVCDESALAHYS